MDIRKVVIKTKQYLETKNTHHDIRDFWSGLGLDSQKQLNLRKNLTEDEILHLHDFDSWKVRLTEHRGQLLQLEQLDKNGRFIQDKTKVKKAPGSSWGDYWPNKTGWGVIAFLITIVIGLLYYSFDRFDKEFNNGYTQGKDTYSNERSNWVVENLRLKKELDILIGDKVILKRQNDSLINELKTKLKISSNELSNASKSDPPQVISKKLILNYDAKGHPIIKLIASGTHAINFTSSEQLDTLMLLFESAGWKWFGGTLPTNHSIWDGTKNKVVFMKDYFKQSQISSPYTDGFIILSTAEFYKFQRLTHEMISENYRWYDKHKPDRGSRYPNY